MHGPDLSIIENIVNTLAALFVPAIIISIPVLKICAADNVKRGKKAIWVKTGKILALLSYVTFWYAQIQFGDIRMNSPNWSVLNFVILILSLSPVYILFYFFMRFGRVKVNDAEKRQPTPGYKSWDDIEKELDDQK